MDTPLREVVLERGGVAAPDAECRGSLLRVGEKTILAIVNTDPAVV